MNGRNGWKGFWMMTIEEPRCTNCIHRNDSFAFCGRYCGTLHNWEAYRNHDSKTYERVVNKGETANQNDRGEEDI